jgi:hypothetical protein
MTEVPVGRQAPDPQDGVPDPAGAGARSDEVALAGTDAEVEGAARAGSDSGTSPAPARGRPLLERVGMAAIALVLALLFGAIALAAFAGGEPFLGAMAGIGCLMTLWVGGLTLVRG